MFLLLEPSFTLFQGTGRVRRAMEAMTELLPSLPLLTCILVPGNDTNIYSTPSMHPKLSNHRLRPHQATTLDRTNVTLLSTLERECVPIIRTLEPAHYLLTPSKALLVTPFDAVTEIIYIPAMSDLVGCSTVSQTPGVPLSWTASV